MSSADSIGEIWLLPFFGQGHLLPTMELCKHIASRNFTATLIISSDLSPSIPSSLRHYPLLQVLEIPPSPPPPPSSSDPMHHHFARHSHMAQALRELLSARSAADLPLCAVVDVMMSWSSEIFKEFHIPMIGFFTSGACSAAMELALWNSRIENLNPGEIRLLPGLPESMAITELDFYRIAGGIRRSNRSGEILAWPVRGDQYYNAQLVVKHLKVGFKICEDFAQVISKDDIVNGIERLFGDEKVKKRAAMLGDEFGRGFPSSSMGSLDAFKEFIVAKSK